jgi:RNA polymerase sigma factor (sigma-70 family)
MKRSVPGVQPASTASSAGFGELFRLYGREVYSYCFRCTADSALAEDLASIVFLEAWRRRAEVSVAEEAMRAWLYGIATNVLRNQRRSRRRYTRAIGRLESGGFEPDFAASVERRLDDERLVRQILERVRELPRVEREVLALCAWQGVSQTEAARALGVPEATVRTRLYRARRRLQHATQAAQDAQMLVVARSCEEGVDPA